MEARKISAFGKTQTVKEWHKDTGIPKNTINYRLSTGMPPEIALAADDRIRREWRYPHVAKERKRALRIFRKTKSIKETAKRMKKSPTVVHGYLQRHGIFFKDIYRKKKRRAWRMSKGGMSSYEIGRQMGMHPSTIRGYIREAAKNPVLQMVDENGYCECGNSAVHAQEIVIKEKATETLELCDDCNEMFLEIEGAR